MKKKATVSPAWVEVKTEVKNLPISPRKLRLVVKSVKSLSPQEASKALAFMPQKGARFLLKALKTVFADAEHNFKIPAEKLVWGEVLVNEGRKLKRLDRFHGARFARGIRQKRYSHLVVKLRGESGGAKS